MKKIIISIVVVVALFYMGFYGYSYYNGPKIKDGVTSMEMDDKGWPIGMTKEFSPEDTVYFSAKVNRFWIKNAQVVWYKGEIAIENRIHVEDNVKINKAGYFTTKISAPEGLEEGRYTVTIYAAGNDIRETFTEFYIKK